MSVAHESIASAFERAAEAAKAAEMAYRKTAAAEIVRLERERVIAFRRVRLVGLLEEAARGAEGSEDVLKLQLQRLCQEVGWSGEAEGERLVLDRLKPVCEVLAQRGGRVADEIGAPLRAFEAWFEADRGVSFYSLFDRYIQETPVVDF